MLKYITKRLILSVLTILLVTTLNFFLLNAIPEAASTVKEASSTYNTPLKIEKHGFDKSLSVRYGLYMKNLLQGDLGISLKQKGRPINNILFDSLGISIRLAAISMGISILFGIPMGCVAAFKRGNPLDSVIIGIATLSMAVPSFVIATVFIMIFSGILPTFGLYKPSGYILPVLTMAFYPLAYITKITRSSMLDALNQNHIMTDKANGLSSFSILFKHSLKNAAAPILTYIGPVFTSIIVSNFIVEYVFNIPGLGRELIRAVTGRDYTVIMGIILLSTVLIVLLNLLIDIACSVIDPRAYLKIKNLKIF